MVSYCVTVLFEISKAAFRAFFWRGWQQRGAVLCGLWDLSSLGPSSESTKFQPLDHQVIP